MSSSNLSNDEISNIFNNTTKSSSNKYEEIEDETTIYGGDNEMKIINEMETAGKEPELKRSLTIIGTGDGGANIASDIKKALNHETIIYNTSKRNIIDHLHMDKFIHPGSEDGSGKVRSYSKEVFKSGAYKTLENILVKIPDRRWGYNIVTTTTDGGTGGGVSPNVAKFTESVTKECTVIVGVYPTLNEDARSQFNTLSWQAEVEKAELPYMIFDNNAYVGSNKLICHELINKEIVRAIEVFSGSIYGESDSLDNQDFSKLLAHGGRINIYSSDRTPRVNESLDEYIFNMIEKSSQPAPIAAEAYGLFIKGPKDLLESVDTNITEVLLRFGGISKDIHIEESNEVCISLIITGSAPANDRLKSIKKRYNDLMSTKKEKVSAVNSLLDGLEDPSQLSSKKIGNELDALDI